MVSVSRDIRSSVSKRKRSSTRFMPKQDRNAGITGNPQKQKTDGKRADPEDNSMMTNPDFTNFHVLVEAATYLAGKRGKIVKGNSVKETHIPRSGFDSEGPRRKKKVQVKELSMGEERQSIGCYVLGESGSNLLAALEFPDPHSQPKTVIKNETWGDSQTYAPRYIRKKQGEKSIINNIEYRERSVQLQEGRPAIKLKFKTAGAESVVTFQRTEADSVEARKSTGADLLEICNGVSVPHPRKRELLGINFYKRIGRWTTHLWAGKQFYIGSYPTASEAARAYDKASLKHFDAAPQLNYKRRDYGVDIKEMATMTNAEYRDLLRKRAKLSKNVYVEEGVTRCPEGWFEVKIKEQAPRTKWRFLGTFDNLKDAKRCYLTESKTKASSASDRS